MKILVVGDAIIDKYSFGEVNRMSPEDNSVPVFDIKEIEYRLGGALNVAANLATLCVQGDEISVSSVCSSYTHNLMKQKGISYKDKQVNKEFWSLSHPSNHEIIKERIINSKTKKQIVRIDNRVSFSEKDVSDWTIQFSNNLRDYDAIVVSDYNKGLIDHFILGLLKQYSGLVFVDTKKKDLSLFEKIPNCIVKINSQEQAVASNEQTIQNLIVTRGKEGCDLYRYGNLVRNFKTVEVDNPEVTGAGDVFLAALVSKYIHNEDIDDAIKFANKAAMLSVLQFGTTTISRELVEYYT